MKRLCLALLTVLSSWGASADVAVTNLSVAQRPGTKLIDIAYDVANTTTNQVWVSLTVRNGASAVIATNLIGQIGGPLPTGVGKMIVWDMGSDWKTNTGSLSFSIWAYDGKPDAPVSKSWQTQSFRVGDDGDLGIGAAWPSPRFTTIFTDPAYGGTAKDNLTGLEWAKNPVYVFGYGFSGKATWNNAIDFCNNLVYAGRSDWRLPSRKELMSLVDYAHSSPILPSGHPFAYVENSYYWSSTSCASSTGSAWTVGMGSGAVLGNAKSGSWWVWPVRGGQ